MAGFGFNWKERGIFIPSYTIEPKNVNAIAAEAIMTLGLPKNLLA
jgi:hypothetical protein